MLGGGLPPNLVTIAGLTMRKLKSRTRTNRIRENYQEAIAEATRPTEDPGLRFVYDKVERLPIRVIACAMGKAINQGGILRVSEAYRAERVTFEREKDDFADLAGARGVTQWLPLVWQPAVEAIHEAKEAGCRIYGLSLTETAKPIRAVNWQFPAALVLGEEKRGMPEEVLEACDECVAIPLWGLITSLNIGQACAIALEHMTAELYEQDPRNEPVRNSSRRLLGLDEVSYQESE